MRNLRLEESRGAQPVGGLESRLFAASMLTMVALFVAGWLALILADVGYTNWQAVREVLLSPEIRAALWLSLCWRFLFNLT